MISDETLGAQRDFAIDTLVFGSGFAGFHAPLPGLLVTFLDQMSNIIITDVADYGAPGLSQPFMCSLRSLTDQGSCYLPPEI